MRLHLVIQRHGLPVTRILWTTAVSPSGLSGGASTSSSSIVPASASAITSSRAPNAAFSNGGYTVAQLLEDVNEVVPLETEPTLEDYESSGQWGLEDYAVEVAGSECLHFMEVEGLLRDGDEVVIRALQTSDLRARRLCGRHQISADGKHLIDGVAFGRPFLKRTSSSRPAISIPPRKKRRTLLSGWAGNAGYEEEDTEWAPLPPQHGTIFDTQVAALREDEEQPSEEEEEPDEDGDYEEGEGTVIRHRLPEPEEEQDSESDADVSDHEGEDLADELLDLKEDLEASGIRDISDAADEKVNRSGYSLRLRSPKAMDESISKSPSTTFFTANERSPVSNSPRRESKVVRFQKMISNDISQPAPVKSKIEVALPEILASDSEEMDSESISSSAELSDVEEDEGSTSESEESDSESEESSASDSEDMTSHSEEDSESGSDADEESASSDSEDEENTTAALARLEPSKANPPGRGSLRTKKSNQRCKMRRRLSKLKELGALPPEADFAALRAWEETNGSWYPAALNETDNVPAENPAPNKKSEAKEKERSAFEAKRLKLLRDIQAGGVDIDDFPEKENVPPRKKSTREATEEIAVVPDDITTLSSALETSVQSPRKRTLDVGSTRRLLFGSLGVKTPKSKEEEENTRKKLAGKLQQFQPRSVSLAAPAIAPERVSEVNWQEKLVVKATECVFSDIELKAPPFPFEQRWDEEALEIINQQNGWNKKKRKRKRALVYQEAEEEYGDDNNGYPYDYSNDYSNAELLLDYDDAVQPEGAVLENQVQADHEIGDSQYRDLPVLPSDMSSVPSLSEGDLKPGSIVAFKQLDMSKDTNWQPKVSDYRVAEVEGVDDGIIRFKLADRDRRQQDNTLDEDGARAYSGFEMPGLEDDDVEDDGVREMSFAELIEPKLLRAAGQTDKLDRVDSQEASIPSPKEPDSVDHIVPVVVEEEEKSPVEVEGDLTQIFWPNVTVTRTPRHQKENDGESDASLGPDSPVFRGFSSNPQSMTPTPNVSRSQELFDTTAASMEVTIACQGIDDVEDSTNGSDYDAAPDDPGEDLLSSPRRSNLFYAVPTDSLDDTSSVMGVQMGELGDGSPRDDGASPETKRKTDASEVNSPRPSKRRKSNEESSDSDAESVVPNPFYAIDKAYAERKRLEALGSLDGPMMFDDPPTDSPLLHSSSSDHLTRQKESLAHSSPLRLSSLIPNYEGSDDEASNHSGVGLDVGIHGDIDHDDNVPSLQSHQPDDEVPSAQPILSQMSEIVDLTQSSPPVSPGGSDEDFAKSHRLPRGPGWVQKNIPSSQRTTRSSAGGRIQRIKELSVTSPSKIPVRQRQRTA
ncbi:hypothetical protein ASPZODRAFT_140439 [Penicilliopsis zonata CBS 506.65]|uniref:DUF7357 domain-containing protein n=1 Tax=Penicilliopsis zonata CBS 506.65 TaxID=1073090 RepID=A0A1L9SLX5_9EURO|nr:hypothetical protein ASPZODRAFT_140439 [Penicilliopsis zonata CBS 506.65]OJJ48106.1 hypothetical protein ASPZODRAFT_140439 [Penicilliopsis zonata CBS 506.65]